MNLGDVTVKQFGNETDFIIKFEKKSLNDSSFIKNIKNKLSNSIGNDFDFRRVENVGPKVSSELLRSGVIAICLSLAAMLIYIWIRFEWQFSLGAILALFHDVIITLGISGCPMSKKSRTSKLEFLIDYPRQDENGLVEGRLLLLFSKHDKMEPRFQISDNPTTGFVFGMDVFGEQGQNGVSVNNGAFGYPIKSLNEIPTGEYFVQVLFHKYETFELKTGHKVKLPMDKGEGQHWYSSPGNYYS